MRYKLGETPANLQGGIIRAAFLGEIFLIRISPNRSWKRIFCSRKATKDELLLI
jgi:hypothetical protein